MGFTGSLLFVCSDKSDCTSDIYQSNIQKKCNIIGFAEQLHSLRTVLRCRSTPAGDAGVDRTMKHIAIHKIFSFFYTDSEEIESSDFEEKLTALNQEIKILLEKYGLIKAETCTSFLGLEKYSICKCENCQHLMVNRDKNPAGFSDNDSAHDAEFIIYNGGEHEGKVLCEECLPITHRWGLHS